MRRLWCVLAVLVAAASWVPGYAFEGGLGQGDLEINGRLAFTHSGLSQDGNGLGSTTDLEFATFLGVFTSDQIQLGGTLFLNFNSVDPERGGSYSGTMFGLGPDLVINFNTQGPIVPFIDIGVGVAVYSGDIYGEEVGFIAPSIQGGIRALIGNAAAANFGAGYTHTINNAGVEDLNGNSLGVFVGFSVFP